jgi:exopolysaccharide biosynthesis predicted pyruvyltransferase EpsI
MTILSNSVISQDTISDALTTINAETIKAFDWLTAEIDQRAPVTFVPNPGNIGDAAINLACFNYLTERFDKVEVCAVTDTPRTECVCIGGGGNLIEPLYGDVGGLLDRLTPGHRFFVFPASIRGYSGLLQRIAPFARILCRESISLAHVAKQIGSQNVSLCHDAAFLLAPRLRNDFANRIGKTRNARCRSFRTDMESIHPELGGNDIMYGYKCAWTNMMVAHDFVWAVASYLLGFREVETDRLHCGILAAILGRQTTLRANSYYKNIAVFDHSLSRLPNTTFTPGDAQLTAAPRRGLSNFRDIRNFGLRKLRGLRRRSRWLSLTTLRWRSRHYD